jgi:hypothetical protein
MSCYHWSDRKRNTLEAGKGRVTGTLEKPWEEQWIYHCKRSY